MHKPKIQQYKKDKDKKTQKRIFAMKKKYWLQDYFARDNFRASTVANKFAPSCIRPNELCLIRDNLIH